MPPIKSKVEIDVEVSFINFQFIIENRGHIALWTENSLKALLNGRIQ